MPASISDSTPLFSNRSMSCGSIGDMNHNDWQKVVRKLSFSDEPTSHDSQQSSSNDDLTDANSQKSETLSSQSSASRHSCQLRLLKVGNVCQSSRKSRQPVIVIDQLTKKQKIRVIDYSSWRWQPKIKMNRLTDDELKNVDRSLLQPNQSEQQHHISPIKFDRDEELIRELSPGTAFKRFQEVHSVLLFFPSRQSIRLNLFVLFFLAFSEWRKSKS